MAAAVAAAVEAVEAEAAGEVAWPCGGDGSGRGPEDFDSTCASNQCGWACQDAKGKDLLTQVLGCTSCDGGECKCVSHQLEHFVRRLNEDAVAAEDSTPQRSSV